MVRILKYILFLCLLVPNISYANIWGRVGECVTSPCSCGCSDIRETWNGQTESYTHYCNCAPYRKKEGRAGCLKKFDPPNNSSRNYQKICAEDPGSNTYFNPKIRVRMQACNAAACWTESMKLNYDGQCTQWPGPYGIPLTRLCARIAVPGSLLASGQDDDGYVNSVTNRHQHLNFEGAAVEDNKVQLVTYDTNPITGEAVPVISSSFLDRPKLCVYEDPWVLDYPLDLMDIHPLYQPFHSGSGISPIAQILITLFDMKVSIDGAIISAVLKPMKVPESTINLLTKIISSREQAAIMALKLFGQLNRSVKSSLGCIDIPLGPFPPPYCSPMRALSTGLSIDPICHTVTPDTGLCPDSSPCVLHADSSNPCVNPAVSSASNNAINNMVRIGFDNFIPLCLPNNVGITPSTCVAITGITTASGAHAANDILPKCGSSPCVNTTLPVAAGGPGFRILYAIQHGNVALAPNPYYTTGIPDCPTPHGLLTGPCQSIWGINSGPFKDVAVIFPAIETSSTTNITTVLNSEVVSMTDLAGVSRSFRAAITRVQNPTDSYASSLGITDQNPSDICVFEVTNAPAVLNGCVARATPPLPTVTQGVGDNFNPSLNVSLTVGTNSTSGVVTVTPVVGHNITNSNVPKTLNIAGFQYSAFVTDNYYKVSPFDPRCVASSVPSINGGCSPNAGSLLGMYYLPNNALVSNDPTSWTTPEPQYLSGLEYINTTAPGMNNAYRIANIVSGPTNGLPKPSAQICLSGMINIGACPHNPRNCVLAKLDADGSVSTDPTQRVEPATSSVILTPSQFYNYSVMNANSDAVSDAITAQIQINPDIVACQYYLSTPGILPTPYSNIQQCSAACEESSIVEYFVSPNPNQVLTICNTAASESPPEYCFWPTVPATTCQVSKLMTLGYLPPVASPPNTAYSSNTKASAIEANLLTTPGSSDVCHRFLGAINEKYPGINDCNSDQITSCSTIIETVSSTVPATTVKIHQCPDNSYCYNQTAGSSPCALGCTGALQQPINISCADFLAAASANYSSISSCSNSVCPSISTLKVNYPTAANCTATTPSCSLVETVNSGLLTVPVNSCSATYTITDSNNIVLASNVETSYYCYAKDNSSCMLDTTNVNRLSAANVVIVNPTTSHAPIICPPDSVTTPPASVSEVCIPDPSQPNVFNPSVCGLRSKTDMEWGICASVPDVPNCPALANENNIQWPSAPPGIIDTPVTAIGCVGAGYSQSLDPSGNPYPLQRYCFANPDASTAAQAPFWGPILNPNAACILTPSCPEVLPTLSNNYTSIRGANNDGSTTSVLSGNAGGMANITCSEPGYLAPTPATVKCVRAGNTAEFASYSTCTPVNCNAITSPSSDRGATWAQGTPGQVGVQGTCIGTMRLPKGGTNPVRDCIASGSSSGFSPPYVAGDPTKNETLGTCVQIQCPAIVTPGLNDGGATWSASDAREASYTGYLGTCAPGYKKGSSKDEQPSRACELVTDSNGYLVGRWGAVINPCKKKKCPDVVAGDDYRAGYSAWPASEWDNDKWVIASFGKCWSEKSHLMCSGWNNFFPTGGPYVSITPKRQCKLINGEPTWQDITPYSVSCIGSKNSQTPAAQTECANERAWRNANSYPLYNP